MKRSDYLLKQNFNKNKPETTEKKAGAKRSQYLLKTKLPEETVNVSFTDGTTKKVPSADFQNFLNAVKEDGKKRGRFSQMGYDLSPYGGIEGYVDFLDYRNKALKEEKAKNLDFDAANKRIAEIDEEIKKREGAKPTQNTPETKRLFTGGEIRRASGTSAPLIQEAYAGVTESTSTIRDLREEKKQLEKDVELAKKYRAKEEAAKRAAEQKAFYLSYNVETAKTETAALKNSLEEAKKNEAALQKKLNAANRSHSEDRESLRAQLEKERNKIFALETKLGDTERHITEAEETQKREWYNSLPQAEDFKKYSEGGFYGNFSPRGADPRYQDMTDEEVAIYRYLANKAWEEEKKLDKDKSLTYIEKAEKRRELFDMPDKYLESLADVLEYRKGIRWGEAARDINNPIGRGAAILGYATATGMSNAIGGAASFLTGTPTEPSALDYAAEYIREDIDGFAGVAYDVTQSLANMFPSVVLGAVTNPAVGAAAMGASSAGNAYSSAIMQGYSENEARTYGWMTGASEAALQYILGGIGSLGGKITNNALAKIVSKIDNAGLKLATTLGGNMASEGFEEGVQTYLEAAFRKTIFDEELNLKEVSEDAIYSAMLGAVTAFLIEGPGTTATAAVNQKNAGIGKEYLKVADAVIKQGLTSDANSETHRIAEELQKKLTEGEKITNAELGRAVRANEEATGKAFEVSEAGVELEGMPRVKIPESMNPATFGENKKTSTVNHEGNVVQYTREEADGIRKDSKTFRNIIAGTDVSLGEFFNKWKKGRKTGEKLEKLYLGRATESVKKKIGELLGKDVPNRDFIITNDAVKHVYDWHGNAEKEAKRGQVAIDKNTIEDLFETINAPDTITKENGRILFRKKTDNGDVTVVEVDNQGRATLAVKTMYIKESTGNTSAKIPVVKTTASSRTSETTEPNPVDSAIIPQESGDVNEERDPADLLSPEYGKDISSVSGSSTPSPRGEGSDVGARENSEKAKSPGLDEYFDDLTERANVISDERMRDAEKALMVKPPKREQTFREKLAEAESHVMRKMVNSGYAIRKIADMTNDAHIYGTYNKARSSLNSASDMVHNKQTDILGRKVGDSLEAIIAPIKEKGDDYYRDFQLYLFHKHNVARMSLKNSEAELAAQEAYDEFVKENPSFTRMSEESLERMRLQEDDRGLRARKYIELRDNLKAAQGENKPIFFEEEAIPMSAEESRARAEELLRKNPDFIADEAKVRKYIDNLMDYRIDSGLITQEEADYFRTKYPDYVPTYRDTEGNLRWIEGKANIGKTIGKAKGSNENILPLDVSLAEMTKKVVRNGQKNIFANKLYDLYENNAKSFEKYITDEAEGKRTAEADIDELGENFAENTVSFYKDGRNIELTVTPELFEAFDTLSRKADENPAWLKEWKKAFEVRKKLVTTYDPTFGIRNGFKDLQDALLNSTDARGLLKNLPKAYKEIATGGEMWELYKAAGGLYSSRFEEMQNEGVKFKSKKAKVAEKLTFANMMIEQAPRLAEFITVYEKGDANNPDTLSDALLAAAEVTTNFGESGTVGKVLNAYLVPFLNPGIQGTAKIARTFSGKKTAAQWGKLAAKTALLGLNAAFFNELITALFAGDDEEEYLKNVDDRIKDNYYLIPTGDGKFIKLPKGRVVASLGIVNERLRDVIKGEKVDVGEALSRIADNTLPTNPLKENFFTPWFEADLFDEESTGRTWYGTDIESESMQSLPVEERYDSSTDYVSRAIGKALKVSPKKANYIIEQYTGGAGRIVMPMITPSEQKGDNVGETIALGAWSSIASNFSVDAKLSNKVSGEFYDAVTEAEQAKNSKDGTLVDAVVYKHLNRERNQMSSYNKTIRGAENDKNLTSKERRAAVRVATAARTTYQETVLNNLPEYREAVEKYLKKYPGTDEEKKLDYAYREANREIYGAEYAIRVNGGADAYKKAAEKVKRGKTTWKEYYDEYFGKTDKRYKAIQNRFDVSYADFEKIEKAISKNETKADEISAIEKLGYKRGVARRIRDMYHETK